MGRGVQDAVKKKSVSELTVHPEIFVERDEANLRADPSHDCSADGEQDQHSVDAKHETGASRDPY